MALPLDHNGVVRGRGRCPPYRPIIARDAGFVLLARARTTRGSSEGNGMKLNPAEGHPAMDYAEHERTYKLFLKLTGYLIISVVIIMALLAIFVV
jgi:hypothetical protein